MGEPAEQNNKSQHSIDGPPLKTPSQWQTGQTSVKHPFTPGKQGSKTLCTFMAMGTYSEQGVLTGGGEYRRLTNNIDPIYRRGLTMRCACQPL